MSATTVRVVVIGILVAAPTTGALVPPTTAIGMVETATAESTGEDADTGSGGVVDETTRLELEKLRQEIRQLELDNQRRDSWPGRLLDFLPLLTALTAVVGALLALWKHLVETSRQRDLDRQQREREQLRRFDELLASAIDKLGSDSEAQQASGAVLLRTFLKRRHAEFHELLYLTTVANLKVEHPRAVNRLLVATFEEALRLLLAARGSEVRHGQLDLVGARLARVDAAGLDLEGADVAFADLTGADLTGANLRRLKGHSVTLDGARLSKAVLGEARLQEASAQRALFHDTDLVAADLQKAVLRGAKFFQARCQSAHMERADLRGAEFSGADVNDAYFTGARWDETALRSMATGAHNWRKAHFDSEVVSRLEALSAGEQA